MYDNAFSLNYLLLHSREGNLVDADIGYINMFSIVLLKVVLPKRIIYLLYTFVTTSYACFELLIFLHSNVLIVDGSAGQFIAIQGSHYTLKYENSYLQ